MQEKYDLISISVLSFLFYGISWLAVKSGLLSKVYHKRFWNSLLLISFLVSGGFGMFLTFQINYDWDISIADDLTFWHVDVGITMFWIALFHVFWHLNYFSKLLKKVKMNKSAPLIDIVNKNSLKYASLSLGFTAFITQVVIIREFLALFSGNELIIGILFFNWLMLTGTGAYAGRFAYRLHEPVKALRFLLMSMAVLPVITLFLMIYLKNKVFLPGTETGLTQIVFYSFLLLIPFNLFSGFSFSLLSYLASNLYQDKKAHFIYAYEAAGSVAAGFLFNFFFIYWLDSFRSLLILLPLNVYVFALFMQKKRVFLFTAFALVFALLFYFPLEKFTKEFLFLNQKIIYQKNSPYGNVILTENEGQVNFYQNGNFLFSSDTSGTGNGNIAENEEAVHFAMLQPDTPEEVLLVSGGVEGQLKELLKYRVKRIDYVEINPALIDAAKRFTRLPQSDKINYINTDVRLFLTQTDKKYDVILLNLPPPLTPEINRYYTWEFFKLLEKHLNKGGIVKTQLPATANYMSKEAERNAKILYSTLRSVFLKVEVLPGEHNYFLASNSAIDLNVVKKINEKQIDNEYIAYYLDDFSLVQRAEAMNKRIALGMSLNYDFRPLAYPEQIKEQMSRFKTHYIILGTFLFLFLVLMIENMNAGNFGMFAVGFASITAELLIMFGFQILYGNIYSLLSVIIMMFMAGLAVGALYFPRYLKYLKYSLNKLYKISFTLLALALVTLPYQFIYGLSAIKIQWLNYSLIFFQTLLISSISGFLFYLSEQLNYKQSNQTVGKIYSADLFGSALAAITVSLFIIPLESFGTAGFVSAGLCVFALILNRKH